jgi:hypothetical protein
MEQTLKSIFSLSSIWIFLIGLIAFILTLIVDWLSPKRVLHNYKWYLQELLCSSISIIIGICLAYLISGTIFLAIISSILFGIIGSTLMRKILINKENIANKIYSIGEGTIDKLGEEQTGKDLTATDIAKIDETKEIVDEVVKVEENKLSEKTTPPKV